MRRKRVVGRDRAASTPASRANPVRCAVSTMRLGESLAPAAVEAVGLGVFVDQALELARIAGKAAVDERRRQVADGHAGDAAFRLRRFARIADDEGIDHRQRAGDDLRKTFRAQRDGLAGQPFQRAVRAHVHERIGFRDMPQPQPNATSAWRGGNTGS